MQLDPSLQVRAYLSCALTGVEQPRKRTIEAFNVALRDAAAATGILVYLPQEASSPDHEDGLTPKEVYILDRLRIAESDVVIADLDRTSFGVGQEIEMACAMGIPVVGYHAIGKSVSRMVLGQPGLHLDSGDPVPTPIHYLPAQAPGAENQRELILKVLRCARQAVAAARGPVVSSGQTSFGVILKAAREQVGLTVERLSRLSGIPIAVIEMLEMARPDLEALVGKTRRNSLGPVNFDRFQSTSQFVIQRLQSILNMEPADFSDLGSPSDFDFNSHTAAPGPRVPPAGFITDLFQPSHEDITASAVPTEPPQGDFRSHELEATLDKLFLEERATYAEMLEVSSIIGFDITFDTKVSLNRGAPGDHGARAHAVLASIRARNRADQSRDGETD